MRVVRVPPIRMPADRTSGLAACEALLAEHLAAAQRRFGPAALGVIDLPPLGPGRLVGEQIRVAAVLYWAYEVEQAGLLPFVEALAQGVIRGTVTQPLGAAIPELSRFWRARGQRFTEPERRALFERLFGGTLEAELRELADALAAIARTPIDQGTTHLEARAAVLAESVGATLTPAGAGIGAFAARDIVARIRGALRLLQHPDVVHGLGGGGPWQIVSRYAPALLGRRVDVRRHVTRATAGLRLITWIADSASGIEAGAVHLPRDAAVIRDAVAWSAASGVP